MKNIAEHGMNENGKFKCKIARHITQFELASIRIANCLYHKDHIPQVIPQTE